MRRLLHILLDVALVCVFAYMGRTSHAEPIDIGLVAATAAPFLAGCALGLLVATLLKLPLNQFRAGAIVWAGTLVVGMTVRAVAGAAVEPLFVLVAGAVLATFLLGWRLISLMMRRLDRLGEP